MNLMSLLAEDSSSIVTGAMALGFPFIFVIVYVIVVNVRRTKETQHREESRREIAAYVAEGSMTVEQAEKLMAAGPKPDPNDKE